MAAPLDRTTAQDEPAACALGMAIVDDLAEFYGVNDDGEVVFQGWFPQETAVSLLCSRPPCVIAVDGQSIPEAFAKSLEGMGYLPIVVPPSYSAGRATRPRSAEALWRIAATAIDRAAQPEFAKRAAASRLN